MNASLVSATNLSMEEWNRNKDRERVFEGLLELIWDRNSIQLNPGTPRAQSRVVDGVSDQRPVFDRSVEESQ